ncbi:MAG: Secreted glycosyl hydrolase, partial [Spirochaetes bacterium]|nr:Secreted glycosyl hydrolase [Spirochaetota bacterium]
GIHEISAQVDVMDNATELIEENNTLESQLDVSRKPGPDLVVHDIITNPASPKAGDNLTFTAIIKNNGLDPSDNLEHKVNLEIAGHSFTGSKIGSVQPNSTEIINLTGSWTVPANGRYNIAAAVDPDNIITETNEDNNGFSKSIYAGRGANVPFITYEAEDANTNALVVGPSRALGTLAGEASGRKAVRLQNTGDYVEWIASESANAIVIRNCIPDAPGGGGITATISLWVNNEEKGKITLSSKHSWLYGDSFSDNQLSNNPSHATPGEFPSIRMIYDDANQLLDFTINPGDTVRLMKGIGDDASYYGIDLIDLEMVGPALTYDDLEDKESYVIVSGYTEQAIRDAISQVNNDSSKSNIFLPAGDYICSNKIYIWGVNEVRGAGMWHTRFFTNPDGANTDSGFGVGDSDMTFSDLSWFGNYTIRVNGPGKIWDITDQENIIIERVWVEHVVAPIWTTNTDNIIVRDSKFANTYADMVNFTNGTENGLMENLYSRGSGDDSFALFSAVDKGGNGNHHNILRNLTSICTWRAAGLAIYGGYENRAENIYIADTFVYSGITISSLDFGYNFIGFSGNTYFEDITVERCGGEFWGHQKFPGIWLFAATDDFTGIRLINIDVLDSTYSGIKFQTKSPENTPFQDTEFDGLYISGSAEYGIWADPGPEAGQGPAIGSVTVKNTTILNSTLGSVETTGCPDFTIIDGGNNNW